MTPTTAVSCTTVGTADPVKAVSVLSKETVAIQPEQLLALEHMMPALVVLPAHDPAAAQRLLAS